ncbi:Flp pilus assembly complex ATPase component TadA [bacterium]|nr:Flp pilus assembly complex ATPase component TadA [bacterium]
METIKTKRLGQILIDAGSITAENLDLALKEQRQTGEKLGITLQRLGMCTEREIARVLAGQAGVACVELAGLEPGAEVLALVPRDAAERHSLVPLSRQGSLLRVAMANPLDLTTTDELSRETGCYVEVVHAPESEIREAILRWYGQQVHDRVASGQLVEEARQALAEGRKLGEADSPFILLVDSLLRDAVTDGATDIHFEPEEKVMRVRYRVDGALSQAAVLPVELQPIVIARLKIMAELNISENRVPQDGRILFDAGRRKVDLRVSTLPMIHGEGIVCRILDKESLVLGLDRLGMPAAVAPVFTRDITRPNGIILVTGPTGSGKTTTLYSALSHLNKPDTKIITLEDPVEYALPVINQAQINLAKGFTFAKGLRAILRQDPDIVLVGEIRDAETAQMAIRAALTGHLVFSTLHTNSAAGAIPRLLDMGVEPFLLSATLVSVLAQRLVRRVCPDCAEPVAPAAADLALLGIGPEDLEGAAPREGKGCPMCRDTGYRGRMAIFEYLHVDPELRRLIAGGAESGELARAAAAQGQHDLLHDALTRYKAGRTTLAEVTKVVG